MTNGQIFDEAAEWFVALREEPKDPAVQDRFLAWLRVSPGSTAGRSDHSATMPR